MTAELPAWKHDDYVETTWGELVELKYGKGLKGYKGAVGDFPVYGTNGLVGFCDKPLCNFPSVVIGRKGAYRGVHYSDTPFYVIDTAYFVVPKFDINLKWAYYHLLTQDINGLDSGSAIPSTRREDFYAMPAKVPPRNVQDEIVDNLDSFNTKIELNRQTNQTLEQIAQAIFKSWFVDFEPVKAKIEAKLEWARRMTAKDDVQDAQVSREAGMLGATGGKDENAGAIFVERAAMCAISGKTDAELDQLNAQQRQQLATTTALFPDALVESELGEIPEGWEVTDLKSVTTELRRGISPKYTEENGIQVINQKCIRNHSVNFDLTRLNDPLKRNVDGRHVEVGDVLVNSTGVGTLGRLAPVRYLPEPTVFDSHVTVVRADTEVISKSFLAGLMLVNEVFIEASGAGSTGQTELRKQVIEEIIFAKPTLELGSAFDAIAEPMNKQIAELEQQQHILAQTRDALLPKLLSGELSPDPATIEDNAAKSPMELSNV